MKTKNSIIFSLFLFFCLFQVSCGSDTCPDTDPAIDVLIQADPGTFLGNQNCLADYNFGTFDLFNAPTGDEEDFSQPFVKLILNYHCIDIECGEKSNTYTVDDDLLVDPPLVGVEGVRMDPNNEVAYFVYFRSECFRDRCDDCNFDGMKVHNFYYEWGSDLFANNFTSPVNNTIGATTFLFSTNGGQPNCNCSTP